jgi:peroxidase
MELLGSYQGYNTSVNPSIANVFATAAFRFGHALVNPILLRLNHEFLPVSAGHLPLHQAFFSPWRLLNETGIDPLLRGLMASPAKSRKPVDEFMNVDLTERLFEGAHRIPLDLAAINIQRGRDHALPGYAAWRRHCGFGEPTSFDQLQNVITNDKLRWKLENLYGHPGESIDYRCNDGRFLLSAHGC